MSLLLSILMRRLRQTRLVTALRMLGLVLSVMLTAAVPVFVTVAMQQELEQAVASDRFALSVLATWSVTQQSGQRLGQAEQQARIAQVQQRLLEGLPAEVGFSSAALETMTSTRPVEVRRIRPDGRLESLPRHIRLGWLEAGQAPRISIGRAPEPGAAEVTASESAIRRYGWQIGDVLSLPLVSKGSPQRVEVRLVGVHARPTDDEPLAMMGAAMENVLLTTQAFWASQAQVPEELAWHLALPGSEIRPAQAGPLLQALRALPGDLGRSLPGADILQAPTPWLTAFKLQMDRAQRFLVVMLLPVYLLLLIFLGTIASATVQARHVEIAVLRSRGASLWQVVRYYLPESLMMGAVGLCLGLLLALPLSRGMGLTAGFLFFVGRPPLPVSMTRDALVYGLLAVLLAEALQLVFIMRAAGRTVSDLRSDRTADRETAGTLRVGLELVLLAATGYGTWQLQNAATTGDDLFQLALPALAFMTAGLLALRLLQVVVWVIERVAGRFVGPVAYLVICFLRKPDVRTQTLLTMLVLAVGFSIYGSTFARALERDMAVSEAYRVGADLTIQPVWEMQVLTVDAEGNPSEVAYLEPPPSQFTRLPGVTAQTQVQLRTETSLFLGHRTLGKVNVLGIEPQGFAATAQLHPRVTGADLSALMSRLVADEEAALISRGLAARNNVKEGDVIRLSQRGREVSLTVAGVVEHFPGRLQRDGDFVVGRLQYLQDELGLRPYSFWYRLEPSINPQVPVDELIRREARVQGASLLSADLAVARRQPLRLTIYAALSIGFLAAVATMGLSYLLGVGLTLSGRAKEMAVVQAMGLRPERVAAALYAEQLFQVGFGALVAVTAGIFLSSRYVPALRQAVAAPLTLPVQAGPAELLLVILLVAGALGMGVLIAAVWLRQLKLAQALRLGEEG